jgi:hypothetical protein
LRKKREKQESTKNVEDEKIENGAGPVRVYTSIAALTIHNADNG